MLLLLTGFLFLLDPLNLKVKLLFLQDTSLLEDTLRVSIMVSAADLVPSILRALDLGE